MQDAAVTKPRESSKDDWQSMIRTAPASWWRASHTCASAALPPIEPSLVSIQKWAIFGNLMAAKATRKRPNGRVRVALGRRLHQIGIIYTEKGTLGPRIFKIAVLFES
jgi:hypothetical protein